MVLLVFIEIKKIGNFYNSSLISLYQINLLIYTYIHTYVTIYKTLHCYLNRWQGVGATVLESVPPPFNWLVEEEWCLSWACCCWWFWFWFWRWWWWILVVWLVGKQATLASRNGSGGGGNVVFWLYGMVEVDIFSEWIQLNRILFTDFVCCFR